MIAVVPSERRSLVAADVSPPASGAVATTAEPRSSSACLAMTGWRVTSRGLRVVEVGHCWRAETRTEQVRSTIASTSSNPVFPTVVRVRHLATRFDGVEVTEEPKPVRIGVDTGRAAARRTSARLPPSIARTRSLPASHDGENCWARWADGS